MKHKFRFGFVFRVTGLILLAWAGFFLAGAAITFPAIDLTRVWVSASAPALALLVLSGTGRWFYQNGIADVDPWFVSVPVIGVWLLALFLTK